MVSLQSYCLDDDLEPYLTRCILILTEFWKFMHLSIDHCPPPKKVSLTNINSRHGQGINGCIFRRQFGSIMIYLNNNSRFFSLELITPQLWALDHHCKIRQEVLSCQEGLKCNQKTFTLGVSGCTMNVLEGISWLVDMYCSMQGSLLSQITDVLFFLNSQPCTFLCCES